jgi:hypothetical protein
MTTNHAGRSLMKKPYLYAFPGIVTVALLFVFCSGKTNEGTAGNTGIRLAPEYKIDTAYNESALFLAGKEIPPSSKLYTFSQGNSYKAYCKRMDSSWARLQVSNQHKIDQWRSKYLPARYPETVFYPFSGPDIINAVTFFPDGTYYFMFGLEAPGDIPRPHETHVTALDAGLSGLSQALNHILNVNYFKTVDMGKDVSTNAFNSITSVIMFFLSRSGHEVLDVRKIWIDENSALQLQSPAKGQKKVINGIEILFRKGPGAPVKRVSYFQLNVIDNSLKTYTNFIPFFEKQGRFTTIIKSASYLMHNTDKFTLIRALTLDHSDYILQDDSGVALRYFDTNTWKLTFHGTYSKPVPLFAHRFQEDLNEKIRKESTGPLPFSYGYNYKENESNLMFAERIRK